LSDYVRREFQATGFVRDVAHDRSFGALGFHSHKRRPMVGADKAQDAAKQVNALSSLTRGAGEMAQSFAPQPKPLPPRRSRRA
jgi:hypothetical protein